jgi:hypothetical protein
VKTPNICAPFSVECISLAEFMDADFGVEFPGKGWTANVASSIGNWQLPCRSHYVRTEVRLSGPTI